jgi:hypothetical protein
LDKIKFFILIPKGKEKKMKKINSVLKNTTVGKSIFVPGYGANLDIIHEEGRFVLFLTKDEGRLIVLDKARPAVYEPPLTLSAAFALLKNEESAMAGLVWEKIKENLGEPLRMELFFRRIAETQEQPMRPMKKLSIRNLAEKYRILVVDRRSICSTLPPSIMVVQYSEDEDYNGNMRIIATFTTNPYVFLRYLAKAIAQEESCIPESQYRICNSAFERAIKAAEEKREEATKKKAETEVEERVIHQESPYPAWIPSGVKFKVGDEELIFDAADKKLLPPGLGHEEVRLGRNVIVIPDPCPIQVTRIPLKKISR